MGESVQDIYEVGWRKKQKYSSLIFSQLHKNEAESFFKKINQ